ncbi:MAG: L-2-hydroxyglutarate oxidase LhgO [Alphaproteobacteria bacterium MarineAlpha2_Bin1]|nr:MAG: L-2-hydroxyglutarate oxidase LhgO [Alphaproteobacteria bacterium MarineAlpha2_Bin1]
MNNSSFDTDVLIIGAGIIGLSIARELAKKGIDVIIVEKNRFAGTEISSRNSEVIHAGIYYPKDSLKTKFCVEGNRKLYNYCEKYKIPYNKCGKLIVSTSNEEINKLYKIKENTDEIGLVDVRFLSKKEIFNLEPELQCSEALFSPTSGIIDSHTLIQSLLTELQSFNCTVAFNSKVEKINPESNSLMTEVHGNGENINIHSKCLINCAGLSSQNIAKKISSLNTDLIPKQYFAKGTYFTSTKKAPFKHLIYPVPENHGLGIHFTLDLSGKSKFGPDLEWINTEEYSVDISKRKKFYDQIKKFWVNIEEKGLVPDYAGIRPKISGPNDEPADFIIQFPQQNNINGLVNLFGIESPGLTASLSIASEVGSRINEIL